MKKFIELFKRWRRGEEIEFGGQININIPFVLFVIAVIAIVAYRACK